LDLAPQQTTLHHTHTHTHTIRLEATRILEKQMREAKKDLVEENLQQQKKMKMKKKKKKNIFL
jgi:hypothetical protein